MSYLKSTIQLPGLKIWASLAWQLHSVAHLERTTLSGPARVGHDSF